MDPNRAIVEVQGEGGAHRALTATPPAPPPSINCSRRRSNINSWVPSHRRGALHVVPLPPCRIVPEPQTPAPNRRRSEMRTRAVECGEELRLFVPGEYPCVRRFRYRRLLTF